MPVTANKGYSQPAFNSEVGTWGTGSLNGNSSILDLNLGGVTSVSLSNVNVTLTGSQAQNLTVTLTGTLTGNVTVKSPCLGFFFIVNNTTGNFAVTLQANFGAGDIGSGLVIPQGVRLFLVSDATSGIQLAAAPSASALVGEVKAYAGSSAPTGWLLCYGQAVSRTIYAALFAVVSTSYGSGDGSTTFNVPDLRGRTVAGFDNMGGSGAGRIDWATSLNTSGGEQKHTQTTSEMPTHSHGVTDPGHFHSYQISNLIITGGSGGTGYFNNPASASTGPSGTGISIQNAGSGTAFNVMQPTLLLNWLIKY